MSERVKQITLAVGVATDVADICGTKLARALHSKSLLWTVSRFHPVPSLSTPWLLLVFPGTSILLRTLLITGHSPLGLYVLATRHRHLRLYTFLPVL